MPGDLQADGDIVERGLPGEQRVGLEQVAGLPVQPGERPAEDLDAAGGGREQTGRDIEQRRLAAAGRPDDGDELAVRDRSARRARTAREGAAVGQPERHRDVVQRHGRAGRDWRPRAPGA